MRVVKDPEVRKKEIHQEIEVQAEVLLKQMGLVKNRREGKTIYYSLADDHVRTMIAQGREHIEEE